MKEKMRKQTLVKRVLALVMTLVMVIGLLPSAPAKAADAVQVVFTGVKSSEATNKTRLYITTSATNSLAGGWTMYYPDSNSGVWYNGTQLSSSYGIYKVSDNEYRIEFNGDNQAAVAGSTIITVEGTFTSTAGASMAVEKTQFQYTSSGWALYTPNVVYDFTGYTFGVKTSDSNANYLYLEVGTSNTNNLATYADTFKAADANSGIWLGTTGDTAKDTKLDQIFRKHLDVRYVIGGSTAGGIGAVEGQILTIKGTLTSGTKDILMPTLQFQFNGTTWEIYEPKTVYDFTGYTFGVKTSDSNANYLYLEVGASNTNDLATYADTFKAADANSGIWLGTTGDTAKDTKLDQIFRKHLDVRYVIGGSTAGGIGAVAGQILTIKGTLTSGTKDILMPTLQFQFNGTTWEIYEPKTVYDFTGYTFGVKTSDSNANYLYLEVGASNTNDLATYADTFKAADVNSGIWLGTTGDTSKDTKLDQIFRKHLDTRYIIGGSTAGVLGAVEGQILTIKGTLTSGTKDILMPTLQFQFNGTTWAEYIPPVEITVVDMTNETFVIKSNSSETIMYLTSTKMEELGKNVPYYADDDDETSGVWLDGEKLKTNTKIQPDGSGVYQVGTFYDASWTKYTAEEGSILVVKGEFYNTDKTIKLIMPELQYKYTSSGWVVYSLEKGDYTANLGMDSRDLVRLKRYLRDSDTEISIQAEFNGDNKLNHADADELRWALVWGYIYDENGIALGMPGYSNKKTLESMAYSAPAVGTWEDGSTVYSPGLETFTPYEDSKIDEAFAKYKEAGLVLISSRHVASLINADINGESNEPFRVFMEAADRNGLKVLVDIDYINAVKDVAGRDDKTEFNKNYACADATGMFDYNYMRVVYNQVCNKLINYPAFAGVLISDEWPAVTADAFVNIMKALEKAEVDMREAGKLNKDLIFTTSQYPITKENDEDPDVLTTDTTKQSNQQEAYKDYITQFGKSGKFTYDLYALEYSGSKGRYVNEEWFTNLRLVSELALSQGIYHTGITIQSSRLKVPLTTSTFERYAPEQQTDIGFQIYTALAYGMKEINYFTYNDHPTDSLVQASMIDNANIYTAVQALNAEIAQFDNVLLHFKWKGALDLAAGKSGTGETANSDRLASASVSGARAIVGCMKDIYGFDGYMVANAAGPRTSAASSVTLTFNNADKVVIYKDGVKSVETLSNNAVTLTVPVGEGVFVIPVKSN